MTPSQLKQRGCSAGNYHCEARTRSGAPCKNRSGFRTTHVGSGKCYLHGGSSAGAPPRNNNAVTTGEYETLHLSALSPDERALYETLCVSALFQAEANLRLVSIREHRILLRIRRIEASATETLDKERGFGIASITTHKGWNVKGKVDFSVTERTSTLDTIQRLEEALTRIQALKVKAIEQLRRLETDTPPEDDPLAEFLGLMNSRRAARQVPEAG